MVTDAKTDRSYEFGPFRLDLSERLLLRNGKVVPLAPKLFETLEILVGNSGRLMGKDDLLHKLWPNSFAQESSLAQNIFQLRKALRDTTQQYIETIPRRGYRFLASVREISDVGSEITAQHSTGKTLIGEEDEAALTVKSLVVLPFRPLGTEGSDDFLGLGMADAVIIKLSELQNLAVMPTSAVFKYVGKKNDPQAIGHKLNVDAVLDGAVQRAGKRVRVTVQLISINNGRALWSGKFDEHFTDIFAVQDSISEQVANAFALKITGDERRQLRKRYTENMEAYQTFLMGLFFWNKRTKEGLDQAIEYFLQAIDKDPSYALAYAGLADSYFLLTDRHYDDLPQEQAYERIEKAALKALELDPLIAEAHTALGVVKIKHGKDSVGAEKYFRRAIAVNQNCAVAHLRYTWFLAAMGRLDEALHEMRRAQELDPLSPDTNSGLGGILYFAREWDEAISHCQRALVIEPTFGSGLLWIGRCYEQKGMLDEAIMRFRQAQEACGADTEASELLAHVLAMTGRRDEAKAILAQILSSAKRVNGRPYNIGLIYAALGQIEQAVEWLGKPYFNSTERLRMLRYDPRMDILRADSRFARILQQSMLKSPVRAPGGHDPIR